MKSLYLLFSLDILNLAIFLPVFSAFIRSLGGTPFTLGLINSSSALVSLLWNPIVGSLSDQVGRKGLLLKCLIASSLGSLLMAISSSIPLVFLGRLIGAFGSPVGILLRSTVADIYKTPADKKMFFNKSAPFMSIAFLVGSLSSGFLSETQNGFSKAFIIMSAVMGFAAILVNQTISNDNVRSTGKKPSNSQSLFQKGLHELKKAALDLQTISWPRYKMSFILKASYDFSIAILTTNLGFVMLNEFNIEGRYMGYVFLMISVLSIASNILKLQLKSFFDSLSGDQMIIKGGLLLIGSFLGMGISKSIIGFLLSLGLMCVAKAFMDTTLTEIITNETTDEDRGKVLGAFENLVPLAAFIVPVISGLVAELLGERFLVISASGPMAIAVIVASRRKIKNY